MRNRTCIVLLVLGVALGACGSSGQVSNAPGTTAGTTPPSQPAPTQVPTTPLVGEWQRETRCEELVAALVQAGLEWAVLDNVVGNSFLPGVTNVDQVADPTKPCEGAVPRLHSHFFTDDGEFGSKDWNGDQVDDGTYELVDDSAVRIGDVTFGFQIVDDTLILDPIIPECAADKCFEAQWAVAVAYPGLPWQRVEGKA